jgi:hypothetical protein
MILAYIQFLPTPKQSPSHRIPGVMAQWDRLGPKKASIKLTGVQVKVMSALSHEA